MSTLPQSLLDAVDAAPEDDAPRLACADWLDRHGDPDRARFIRLQCALEALPEPIHGWTAEGEEVIRLYSRQESWLEGRPTRGVRWEFLRGFPEVAIFESLKAAEENEKAIFRWRVRRIEFIGLRSVARLPRLHMLSRVRELVLSRCKLGDDGLRQLLASPHLVNLTRLELPWNNLGPAAAEALAGCPRLADLEHLELGHYFAFDVVNPLGPDGARSLAGSAHLGKLRYLGLGHTRIADAGLAALARSATLAGLTALDVADNGFTPEGMRVLRQVAPWPGLRWLRLEKGPIGDAGAADLASVSSWRQLLGLNLGDAMLGDGAVSALARASWLEGLQYLWLDGNAIRDAGARTLADSSRLGRLVFLYLARNLIGDQGAWALAQSPHLTSLRKLRLRDNPVNKELQAAVERRYEDNDPEALAGLAPKPVAAPLPPPAPPAPVRSSAHDENTLLNAIADDPDDDLALLAYADWLEENGQPERAGLIRRHLRPSRALPDQEAQRREAVAVNEWLSALQPYVVSCEIRRGLLHVQMEMRAFLSRAFQAHGADWLRQAGVEGLILSGHTTRFDHLAASPALQAIRDLELHCPRLKDAGLRDLVGGPPLPSLHTLALWRGGITRSGVEALAASTRFPRLRRLVLGEQGFDVPGFQALGGWPQLPALRALELPDCRFMVGDLAAGLSSLFRPDVVFALRRLEVANSYLTDRGAHALAAAGCLAGLRHLGLASCYMGDAGVAALLEAPFVAGLERLGLQHNLEITSAAARLLAGCPGLARLRSLNLLGCELDGEGLHALLDSPHLHGLQQLLVSPALLQEGDTAARYWARFRVS